jgi:Flp pilus assembly pilin Flp
LDHIRQGPVSFFDNVFLAAREEAERPDNRARICGFIITACNTCPTRPAARFSVPESTPDCPPSREDVVSIQLTMEERMKRLLQELVTDEQGTELVESALILGLMVLACYALLTTFGANVLSRWQAISEIL